MQNMDSVKVSSLLREFTYWIIKSVYYFNKSINHIVPCWLNESFIVNINLQQNK